MGEIEQKGKAELVEDMGMDLSNEPEMEPVPVNTSTEEKPKRRKRASKKSVVSSKPLIDVFFGILAARNPKWVLSKEESKALSQATDALLEKYTPSLGKYTEEFTFAIVVISIVMPRLETKRKGKSDAKE